VRPLIAVTAWLAAIACGGSDTTVEIPARVRATVDGETPIAGVTVSTRGGALGETDADGVLAVGLRGAEGAVVPLIASCPGGYRVVHAPGAVTLRAVRTLDESQPAALELSVECAPILRTAVLVVRAAGHGDLPVLVDDDEVTRTNEGGVAHVAFRAHAGTRFSVRLDTTERPDLRPQNPRAVFVVPDAPEMFVYDQPFETGAPDRPVTPRRRRRGAPMKALPMRLSDRSFHP
jgi:hypothetical protein